MASCSALRRPRIEGRFVGDEIRAWRITWGNMDGDFVVEDNYACVSRGSPDASRGWT